MLGERPNQLERLRPEVQVSASDLLDVSTAGGTVTAGGVRSNVTVALRYIEAWLRGTGAVAIDNLMEDAATAEISRSLLRQWIENRVVTEEGILVDRALVGSILGEELARLGGHDGDRFDDAAEILREVALGDEFPTFLTIPAYTRFLVDAREPELALAG